MSVFKLAPAEVVHSDAAEDLALLQLNDSTLNSLSSVLFSADPENGSIIVTGEQAGKSFAAWLGEQGKEVLGSDGQDYAQFPFTIRQLIAGPREILFTPSQKTEAFWFVMKADAQAKMYFAQAGSIEADQLEAALNDGSWKELLHAVPVSQGDIFALEPGTICAMEYGVRILEVAANGKGHGEEVVAPHDYHHTDWVADGEADQACAGRNSVFELDLYRLDGRIDLDADGHSCKAIVLLDGTAVIDDHEQTIHTQPGSVVFVPASSDKFHMTGDCGFALIHLV